MARTKVTPIERFWAKVHKEASPIREGLTPCWVWTANRNWKGYGQIVWQGCGQGAHRISWLIHFGQHPGKMLVLHHCDNPPCVNPEHLFLGTHQDNHDDMWTKGRGWSADGHHSDPQRYRTISTKNHHIGEQHPNAKLTKEKVKAIRYAHEVLRVPQARLAQQYNVDRATIRDVVLRRSWAHV